MAISGVVTSTLSSIVNNIVIVVNDGKNITSNNHNHGEDLGSYNNDMKNLTISTLQPAHNFHTTPTSSGVDESAVAEGQSWGQLIAVCVMLVVFSIFGTLGNGLVLYVFTRKSDKVTSTIFILALAWTDFFTCLIIMPFTVTNIQMNSHLYYDAFCKIYNFLITCNVPLSAFIMVAISVDRYFSICHPFLHVVTPRRARISILCLLIFAFSLGSITACIFGTYKTESVTETAYLGEASWCQNMSDIMKSQNDSSANDGDKNNFGDNNAVTDASTLFANNIVEILITNNSFRGVEVNTTDQLGYGGLSEEDVSPTCTRVVQSLVYQNGLCVANEIIFSEAFVHMYQKIYMSFYFISLLAVFTLYFFIYRSVVRRRAWRRKQKSSSHSPMTMTAVTTVDNTTKNKINHTNDGQNMELTPKNNTQGADHSDKENSEDKNARESTSDNATATTAMIVKSPGLENGVQTSTLSPSAEKKTNRERRDFNFLANIRTAIMLFVVAVVFIFSFLPAWLMATNLLGFQIIIFYMHFVYNVANPVIYAFMNQSFRKELKRVFQRDCVLKCCKTRRRLPSDRGYSRTGVTAVSVCESLDEAKGCSLDTKPTSEDSE